MHQTKKGNQWDFGMKVHVGADVNSRASAQHPLTKANKRFNHRMSSIRARVEHVFRVIKRQFGYTKVR